MLQNKNILMKKYSAIFSIVLTSCLLFSYPAKTQAALWPAIDPIMDNMFAMIRKTVEGMVMGAGKQAAVKMLLNQMESLASGQGADSAVFITDWKDYLVNQPKNSARVYMNSYLSQMTTGRGTSTGYISEGFAGAGNYAAVLTQSAKNSIEKSGTALSMTYEGNPAQMFAGGSFKNIGIYASGVNNPWAFSMKADNAYQAKLTEEKEIQQAQAIAYQGFKGTSSGSGISQMITRPGILTKETLANVENLPNNVIAAANNIPEIITSVVSNMITKSIQQGFNGMQKSAQSQSSSQNKLEARTTKCHEQPQAQPPDLILSVIRKNSKFK